MNSTNNENSINNANSANNKNSAKNTNSANNKNSASNNANSADRANGMKLHRDSCTCGRMFIKTTNEEARITTSTDVERLHSLLRSPLLVYLSNSNFYSLLLACELCPLISFGISLLRDVFTASTHRRNDYSHH